MASFENRTPFLPFLLAPIGGQNGRKNKCSFAWSRCRTENRYTLFLAPLLVLVRAHPARREQDAEPDRGREQREPGAAGRERGGCGPRNRGERLREGRKARCGLAVAEVAARRL